MTYKEKVIKDYGIDPTNLACPCDIFDNAYDCFADNNEDLMCAKIVGVLNITEKTIAE